MKQIDLKQYLKENKLTYAIAARQLDDMSPQHLEAVANGREAAGRPLCVKLARWGAGRINLAPLMMIEKGK